MVSSGLNLDDGRNNLLRVYHPLSRRVDSAAPLRSRDASCLSIVHECTTDAVSTCRTASDENQNPVGASSEDNVSEKCKIYVFRAERIINVVIYFTRIFRKLYLIIQYIYMLI